MTFDMFVTMRTLRKLPNLSASSSMFSSSLKTAAHSAQSLSSTEYNFKDQNLPHVYSDWTMIQVDFSSMHCELETGN